jgi:hypothetical protein
MCCRSALISGSGATLGSVGWGAASMMRSAQWAAAFKSPSGFCYHSHKFVLTRSKFRMTKKSVNWLVKFKLIHIINAFITYLCTYLLNLQKLFEMRSSMFSLNLNIPANTKECFKLTDFWTTLYAFIFLL